MTTSTQPFERLLYEVLYYGETRTDRTRTGTLSLFAPRPLTYSLDSDSVPLITSKRVAWKSALAELFWMLSGSTDVADLRELSPSMANVWSNWADSLGDVGATYGAQYRNAGGTLLSEEHVSDGADLFHVHHPSAGIDQLRQTIVRLAGSPDTRRAVISLWSAPELSQMGIEPCLTSFQFSLRGDRYDRLSVHVYQRSADLMLGVPFDLFQVGVLTHLIARELRYITGRHISAHTMTWSAGDVHVYQNQTEAAILQLEQAAAAERPQARIDIHPSPSYSILDNTLQPHHVQVYDYNPMPAISAPLAV